MKGIEQGKELKRLLQTRNALFFLILSLFSKFRNFFRSSENLEFFDVVENIQLLKKLKVF